MAAPDALVASGSSRWSKVLTVTSQYSDETATYLAQQLLEGATPDMTIVVVSAPSVFVQLKNLVVGHYPPISATHSTVKLCLTPVLLE